MLHNLSLAASSDQCFAFWPNDEGGVWLLSSLLDSYDDDWYCSYNEIQYQCFLAYWPFMSYISKFRSVYIGCEVISSYFQHICCVSSQNNRWTKEKQIDQSSIFSLFTKKCKMSAV